MGKHVRNMFNLDEAVSGAISTEHIDQDLPLEQEPVVWNHNHQLQETCGSVGCTTDRFRDGAHRFLNVRVDTNTERAGNLGEVIDRRVQVYGDPVIGFAEIAEMWTTYLGYPVQAHQVPMMFILMKIVRSKTSPDYSDHSDDIEGYLDIFRKVIGEDMIQARTVNEYIEKKWPGEQ